MKLPFKMGSGLTERAYYSTLFNDVRLKMVTIFVLAKLKIGHALADVMLSLSGTLGMVFIIASIVAVQSSQDVTTTDSFLMYFNGGQIGLPILSLCGIIFLAFFRRHKQLHPILAWLLYVIFFGSSITTAIIIGINPGFASNELKPELLKTLWIVYGMLHVLWFFILVFEPSMRSEQERAEEEYARVKNIKPETD